MELVVDIKAEVLDPLPRSLKLFGKPKDKQRVERIDDEAAKGGQLLQQLDERQQRTIPLLPSDSCCFPCG